MKKACENPYCKNPASKKVRISTKSTASQTKMLCTACEKAFAWGISHGKTLCQRKPVWVLAVADKGIIVYSRAFSNKKQAEKALTDYARFYESYQGSDDLASVNNWLAEKEERLSVNLCCTSV